MLVVDKNVAAAVEASDRIARLGNTTGVKQVIEHQTLEALDSVLNTVSFNPVSMDHELFLDLVADVEVSESYHFAPLEEELPWAALESRQWSSELETWCD